MHEIETARLQCLEEVYFNKVDYIAYALLEVIVSSNLSPQFSMNNCAETLNFEEKTSPITKKHC